MDEDHTKAMIDISLQSAKMAFELAMAVQTQVVGSIVSALMQKGVLTGPEASAMLTQAADGLSYGVKSGPISEADVGNAGLKNFIEGLLTLAEHARNKA